jgi:hypothetical protein
MTSPSLAAVALLVAGTLATPAPVALQPGEYRITATIVISNAPPDKPEETLRCLTPKELANPEAVFNNRFMANFQPDANCKINGLTLTATSVRYSTDCTYATAEVEGTLSATSYSVTRKGKNKSGRGPSIETKLEGKRVGACPG